MKYAHCLSPLLLSSHITRTIENNRSFRFDCAFFILAHVCAIKYTNKKTAIAYSKENQMNLIQRDDFYDHDETRKEGK